MVHQHSNHSKINRGIILSAREAVSAYRGDTHGKGQQGDTCSKKKA